MTDCIYVLDANVFIEAARRYYAFDLAPGFWDNLLRYAENGQIISIDRVKQELARGHDDLADWIRHSFHEAFVATSDSEVLDAYRRIVNWVNNSTQFSDAAKADFASVADGWLIAYALAKGCVIVTHEVVNVDIRRKVPIPNVCQAFNIQFVDTFTMLRSLGVRFA